ncbi:hypothetical protein KocCE7_11555 [Kocuria marina subsp. indica]|uniref:hypothetical protein n=1 Tax=Kocuria TaxID=57493 RepID=UPI00103ED66E|nr:MULTISPECIES: hypothetical protein [Kocuria]MDT0120812.1 hypothetical protein [Kocuria sp. PD6]QBJ22329.1 hypothetical protein KocCE7_11555 [Kocuria indica]
MTPTSSYTSSGTGRRSQEFTPATAVRGFLEHSRRRAADLSPGYERVWARVAEVAYAGNGLQQDLVMAAVEAYPARPTRPVLNAVAAGFELLNTALLLRGEGVSPGTAISVTSPAASRTTAPGAGGVPSGGAEDPVHYTSLASELALAAAYRMVATSHAPETRLIKLLEILDHSVFHAAAGERILGELTQRAATVSHGEVLETLRIGSAVPCYEAPLRAGAVLGGAPTQHVNALADTGRALGMAHGLAKELRLAAHTQGGHGARELLRADRPTVLGTFVASGPHGPAWRSLCERAAEGTLTDDDAAHAHQLLERSGSVRAVARMMGTARTRSEHAMAGGGLPPALVERLRAWAERELGSAAT